MDEPTRGRGERRFPLRPEGRSLQPANLMPRPAALECRDLSAGYDKLVVVRKLDLAVRHKEILAVLGPNGAGKTTLLMTLAGFLAQAGGTITMDGAEVRYGSPRRANRAGIVLVPDYRA